MLISDKPITLQQLRQNCHLTQVEVAYRANAPTSLVAFLERGYRPPTLKTVKKCMKGLGAELILVAKFKDGQSIHFCIPEYKRYRTKNKGVDEAYG